MTTTNQPISRYDQIMLNSARLFREKGYPATSIRNIGDSMGITSAALYYHFKNKDEVLLGIMRQGLTVVNDRVIESIASEADSLKKLKRAVQTHTKVSLSNRDFAAVLLRDVRHLKPESQALVIAARDAYEQVWSTLLENAFNDGHLRKDVDLHLLRLMIFGTLNQVTNWYQSSGEYSPAQIAETYFDYIFHGITEVSHA